MTIGNTGVPEIGEGRGGRGEEGGEGEEGRGGEGRGGQGGRGEERGGEGGKGEEGGKWSEGRVGEGEGRGEWGNVCAVVKEWKQVEGEEEGMDEGRSVWHHNVDSEL